jgi:hypothetical protein
MSDDAWHKGYFSGYNAGRMAGEESARGELAEKDEEIARLREALATLVEACERDFCSHQTENVVRNDDEEAVATGADGDCALRFGHIRNGRKALRENSDG